MNYLVFLNIGIKLLHLGVRKHIVVIDIVVILQR